MTNSTRILLGTDIGGTFTDLVAFDARTGSVTFGKSLTRYDDLVEGIADCVTAEGVDLREVDVLKHGTTQVINTLLERRGAKTALVTTRGFRDLIEIGRASRPLAFDLDYQRLPPLIPPELRFEVGERVSASGEVLAAPGEPELEQIAAQLSQARVEAVAVAFLNSYRAPGNELAVASWLRARLPHVFVSCSTELSREWFEYERLSTAAANAYVGPRAASYVDRLQGSLGALGLRGELSVMGSNGGVMSPARAKIQPLMLVESGPIGGCIGAVEYARALGVVRMIAFDMGGTTAKCALIEDYTFDVEPTYNVGGYDRGFPVRVPVLDIVEVGTGGGSIADVDAQGRLRVGPRSAGSQPGPVCFGRGGDEPTITDANLVLGRISSGAFMRGALHLDRDAAARAIGNRVARPLGYSGEKDLDTAASGILALAGGSMAGAIKEITVERGRDARDYTLFLFGGGGPLHGVDLARELGIGTVVVPPEPGNFSALGMLFSDARLEESRTLLMPLDDEGLARAREHQAGMAEVITASLRAEVGAKASAFEVAVELRFAGQRHAIRVALRPEDSAAHVRKRFLSAYLRRYGYADESAAIELVALRVVGIAASRKPDLASLHRSQDAAGSVAPQPREWRSVFHAQGAQRHQTPVYERSRLPRGWQIEGPAIIEEFGSTTVIGPGDRLQVGDLGELAIRVAPAVRHAQPNETIDPIEAGLISQTLAAIPNVIEKNISRTAFSLLVSEYKDFAVGIVAPDGRLITQSKGGLPVFAANALSVAVQEGLRLWGSSGLQAGDVVITNTAATMGQHLNNVVMFTPIRTGEADADLLGFMVVVMHWMDVGGYAVGSCTTTKTTDVFQEGIQYPSLKLFRGGMRAEDVFRLVATNTRFPQLVLGDAASQAAGCMMGCDMILEAVHRFGADRIRVAVERYWEQSENSVRSVIRSLPEGIYEAESFLDDDGVDKSAPLPIKVRVTVRGSDLSVDLGGLAREVTQGPWNAGLQGGAVAAVRIAAKMFFRSEEAANDGAFRAIRIICPDGTLMSASPTAAIAGSGHNLPTVVDTILAALSKAAPERVPAAHHGTYGSQVMVARALDGVGWMQHMESSAGGWGAAHDRDGNGPFRSIAHGDTPEIPLEVQESWGLYRIEHMKLRCDSGGAGRYRGGLGVERQYTILRDVSYSVMIERTKCPPWGLAGGLPGAPGRAEVMREGVKVATLYKDDVTLRAGDSLLFRSGGGGGYGPPLERPLQKVVADVLSERISRERARDTYGVVVGADGEAVETAERQMLSRSV